MAVTRLTSWPWGKDFRLLLLSILEKVISQLYDLKVQLSCENSIHASLQDFQGTKSSKLHLEQTCVKVLILCIARI